MTAAVQVAEVASAKERKEFIHYPEQHYADDPRWMPPFYMFERDKLNTDKNPFFRQAEIAIFLARRDGQTVGRVAAFIDRKHNHKHAEKIVFFGYYEATDAEVSAALLQTAENWGKERGMTHLRGPVSLKMEEGVGFQISGYGTSAYMLMHYNGPEYPEWMERSGLAKIKDLYAWIYHMTPPNEEHARLHDQEMERMGKLVQRVIDRAPGTVRLRTTSLWRYPRDIRLLYNIYNQAWQDNWGFVPNSDEEIAFITAGMGLILYPELLIVVEVDGEPAGAALVLPDINELSKACNGRLWPTGWLQYFRRHKIFTRCRLAILGVLPKWRRKGLEAVLIQDLWRKTTSRPTMQKMECSWVLEDNKTINHSLAAYRCEHYKTYRLYQKAISA